MSKNTVVTGVLIEESTTYTLVEVCHRYNISEELLQEMIEQGLFPNQKTLAAKRSLEENDLRRIESAIRLHRALDINLPGVVLAIELLDEIDELRDELAILRRHIDLER